MSSITVTNVQDGNGNLTQHIWRKPNGTTNLVQTLAWNGRGRLYKVTERDRTQSGRDFTVTYDGFGRRLRTTEIAVTNNIALTNSPLVTDHYFDPAVEFLELGVNEGGKATWKLMGPDFDGRYGGQNGTGGFEAMASGSAFSPVVSDALGNVLATVSGASLSWSSNRVSAYGGVPGYRAPAIGSGNVGAEYSWRDRAAESIGFVWMGGNWLDPVSGRFIAFDPLGHAASDNGYSFCGGNPVGYNWDADGRCVQATRDFIYNGGAAGYGLRQLGGYLDSYNNSSAGGGYFTGLSGSIVNELAGASAPSSYVNGLQGFGNNVSTIYNDGGLMPAASYAISGWNVGKVYSGGANLDLVTGEPVGDWYARGTQIASGTASTAGIAAGGLGIYNWATAAPASVPPIISTTEGGSQTYQIMDGVRRATAANYTGATTIEAEILDANMVSQGVKQVPINSLLSPKDFIDFNGSGLYRWNRVLEGTQTGAKLPPIQITPGSSGIPIRNVTIGNP